MATARQRKRDATGQLRELASELGVSYSARKPDLSKQDFEQLHATVMTALRTPDQRDRAAHAAALFDGDGGHAEHSLPAVPPLPAIAHSAGQPSQQANEEPVPEDGQAFRLRSSACLFTWNNSAYARMVREELWQLFLAFLRSLDFLAQWTATMEMSLKSADQGRLHLHAFVEFRKSPDWTSLDMMKFRNGYPNASPCRARGDNQRQVMDEGHFYCYAWKLGTVYVETSGYVPWKDYRVAGAWIDHLWSDHKLDHDTYLKYAAEVRVGFINRSKQVDAIREREKREHLRLKRNQIAFKLAALRKETKAEVLEMLNAWKAQYDQILERYKFLVIRGATRTGKSTLARSLGKANQVPFIQTVQSATDPDLKNYDPDFHSFIIFDNVNDVRFVMDYRALLQANNDIHVLGASKTGMYSYEVWLHCVPIVITVDLSAKWNSNDEWIKENCIEILLDGPCWVQD